MVKREEKDILWFDELHRQDVHLVGGKSSSLGELTSATQIPVPYGFATTTHAYQTFMAATNLNQRINDLLATISDYEDTEELRTVCAQIRSLIISAEMPSELAATIKAAYEKLATKMNQDAPFVAVRSSATAEDLPDASFAGQQETYLNVRGADLVVRKVQECYASLFTDRATYYRHKQHFPHEKVALSAAIQMMVFSKAAGIMFSVNVANGNSQQVVVDSILGLGEYIVLGKVTPDHYVIDKASGKIVDRTINNKAVELVQDPAGGTHEQKVPADQATQPALTDSQVRTLAEYAKRIERHYGCYMDMEFALDRFTNKLWLVQARPETVWANKDKATTKEAGESMTKGIQPILKGLPASPGLASGRVHAIADPSDIDSFKTGEMLVTPMTSPDWVPAMKKAAAIITNNGGMTCHAAIVSREMQIPCLVGTASCGKAALELLHDGDQVTVDAKNGVVYSGDRVKELAPQEQPSATSREYFIPTATRVMMNLGDPSLAERYVGLPADGIGLMREEFIWTTTIPLYLIKTGRPEKAVDGLAERIAKVARTMMPRPVVLRFSDFKSGEYRHLTGGEEFEPHEPADLLGWRGAARYYDPRFIEAFKLELAAVKKVRTEYGLTNLNVMIPFVRTVDELAKIIKIMAKNGLKRSADFKVYMMAEIPANIILADKFNQYIDGYSIGSNDLSMLILGCDRNNDTVSGLFDERNLAVKRAIRHLITVAHKDGKTVSICGQAPSEYPEFADFLIRSGIDYLSVNPDMVKETRQNVAHFEQRLLLDRVLNCQRKTDADVVW
ncbi:phosphoenolpyruvate synthase [Limosilactobacillus sp.]|uniref:phosphoenolpyruvate synthase n=1 Tax=Limosilactobacillus sp. TaxID=2773925 RepID=UPI003F0315C6